MFLFKLPWKIFCYFLDGIFRVTLLGLLAFFITMQSDSVQAHISDLGKAASIANHIPEKVKSVTEVTSKAGDTFDTIRTGLSKISEIYTGELFDEEGSQKGKKQKNVKGDPNKPWFQAKIY